MAGTFAPSASIRGLAWGIDGTALVMAGAILTIVFYRMGQDSLLRCHFCRVDLDAFEG